MAPPRLVPDKNTLIRWQEEGLTHEDMAERVYTESGHRISRTAISAAFQRYGLAKEGKRYKATLPWTVVGGHAKAMPARMLRLLGKRLQGDTPLNEQEQRQLDRWLEQLDEQGSIVGYDPDDDMGFHYIDKSFRDHDDDSIPIRRQQLHLRQSTIQQ